MSAAIRADFTLARTLFVAGCNLKEVADKTGIPYTAIAKRCSREKWKDEVRSLVQRATQGDIHKVQHVQLMDLKSLAIEQNNWKHRVLRLADKHLARLESKSDDDTLTLDEVEQVVRIADKTDVLGRRQLGLDAPTAGSSLHVHVGRDSSTAPRVLSESNERIIDVSSSAGEASEAAR